SNARVAISKTCLSRISLALGSRAGAPGRRLGRDPAGVGPVVVRPAPHPARRLGPTRPPPGALRPGRARHGRLWRYGRRPPAAQEGLRRRPDGRVLVASRWATGTWALMPPSAEAGVKPLLGCDHPPWSFEPFFLRAVDLEDHPSIRGAASLPSRRDGEGR